MIALKALGSKSCAVDRDGRCCASAQLAHFVARS